MRPYHRGAYEHLWADHKYSAMAISLKFYQSVCRRFTPKSPQILFFLKQLFSIPGKPRAEEIPGILNAYEHLKRELSRKEREEIIEGILSRKVEFLDRVYELLIERRISFLYGCRLFFPQKALNKFWDVDGGAGLWICLGPFLAFLSGPAVRVRLKARAQMSDRELDEILSQIKIGMNSESYDSIPPNLREALENILAIARPGKKVFLHPRFPYPLPSLELTEEFRENVALLAIEKIWDEKPEIVPELPSFVTWKEELCQDFFPEAKPGGIQTPEEMWEQLYKAFEEQKKAEPCLQKDDFSQTNTHEESFF